MVLRVRINVTTEQAQDDTCRKTGTHKRAGTGACPYKTGNGIMHNVGIPRRGSIQLQRITLGIVYVVPGIDKFIVGATPRGFPISNMGTF